MDTKKDSAASEVPTFKVARVGQERKRKGGGFSFLRGGSAPRGVWQGAAGGSGAGGAGAAGMTISKVMTIIMVTSFAGTAAVYTGSRSAAATRNAAAPAKPTVFAQDKVKIEGDTSHLPSTPNTIPNSMGFITGSKDGLTPEERAKKEADAAAAAEAQRIADEEAAKKEAANTAANPAVDPNAMLASAQADGGPAKGAGFGKKFGALSSGMGGGSSLSGGAGMSGGVNRQFGGGGGGAIMKGKGGSIASMKGSSRPTYSKSGNSWLAASRTKGFARKQRANANAYSRRGATAGKGESSASDAGAAFDNNPGAGNTIEGPGIGKGKGAESGADSTANPNNGGPTGGGGPSQVDCGPDRYQNVDGGCSDINTNAGTDANPMLSMMAGLAMMLLMVIGVLSMMSTALKATGYGTVITPALMGAICALGAIVTLLGVAMMAMGDYVTGGIATLIGGIVTYMAYGAEASLTIGQGMVAGFGGAALSLAGKMLGGSSDKNKAPVAAQQ